MSLIPDAFQAQLLEHGRHPGRDYPPVVKLDIWIVNGQCISWLVNELDPERPYIAHGLSERWAGGWSGGTSAGHFDLNELEKAAQVLGFKIEPDEFFVPRHPLSVYVEAAREHQYLTDCVIHLYQAKQNLQNRNRGPSVG